MIFEDSTIMSERVITLAVEDANNACSSLRKINIEIHDECPLYIIRSQNKVCLNCSSSTKLSKMTYEVAFPTTKTRNKRNRSNEDEMHTCQECSTPCSSLKTDVYVCVFDPCRHKSRQFVCTICWNSDKEKPEQQILISTDDIAKPDSKNALLYRGSEEINACSFPSSQSGEEIKNSIFGLDSPDSASGN